MKTPADLANLMALTLSSVKGAIESQAHNDIAACVVYAEHVFAGGDPSRCEGIGSWHYNPVRGFAKQINNAYRIATDRVPSPYSPANAIGYLLFDTLAEAMEHDSGWVTSRHLRALAYGSHVTSYLKDQILKPEGYVLEKNTANPVMYRLVKIDQ